MAQWFKFPPARVPDLDHVLGLLLLRELQPFQVCATESVISILRGQNSMFGMLNRVPDQVRWNTIRTGEQFSLSSRNAADAGLACKAVALSSRYPAPACLNQRTRP